MAVNIRISIGDLAVPPGRPGLSIEHGGSLGQAAIVCLLNHGHSAGVQMALVGDQNGGVTVEWEAPRDVEQALRTWNDLDEAAEHGASGLAILVVEALTELTVMKRAKKRGGFDYWMGERDQGGPLFQGRTRLEVSGTNSPDNGEFKRRIKLKLDQTKRSDSTGLLALVAIIEFVSPRQHLQRREPS